MISWLKHNRDELISIALILAIGALAYLPFIGSLGLYHDDWHLLAGRVGGVTVVQMQEYDRPGIGYEYALFRRLLGFAPLGWHLFAFTLRELGAISFFWFLRLLFPKNRLWVTAAAILMLIYPGFLQQPSAVTYQTHFLVLLIATLSLSFSILSLRNIRGWISWGLRAVSGLGTLAYLFLIEYFIGFELIRLAALWFVSTKNEHTERAGTRVWNVLKADLFNLLATVGYLIWRIFFFTSGRVVTDINNVFQTYLTSPFLSFTHLVVQTTQDFIETVFIGWGYHAHFLFNGQSLKNILLAGTLASVAFLGWIWFLWKNNREEWDPSISRLYFWGGVLMVFAGIIPIVASGRDVQFVISYNRYTMPGFLGAAIIAAGVIFGSVRGLRMQMILSGFLIFLAVFTQVLNGAFYKDNWAEQRSVWWQLSWRAPQLQPGTLLMVMLPEVNHYGEDFEIFTPANLTYYPGRTDLSIVADILNADTLVSLRTRAVNYRYTRSIYFQRDYTRALVVGLDTPGGCLHVLDQQQIETGLLTDPFVQIAAAYSQIDQIELGSESHSPPVWLFGSEPEHNWCYYYQRASLARQQGNWEEVARLGDEAISLGFSPADLMEWLPFLEGWFVTGENHPFNLARNALMEQPIVFRLICTRAHEQGFTAYLDENDAENFILNLCRE